MGMKMQGEVRGSERKVRGSKRKVRGGKVNVKESEGK